MQRPNSPLALALIILAYLLIGALYALQTPDWQVPDEPAHYNYVRQLAEQGRLPELKMGDYDQDYLGQLTSQRFPPGLSVQEVEYEDHQPPLYYLLATPVYLIFDGALEPLRFFSLLLGAGVVCLAYAVAREVASPRIALGTAALVAFLPQHVAMMAGVNNDSLAELLIGLALWMTLRWARGQDKGQSATPRSKAEGETDDGARWLVGLGLVLGLGLVTKMSVLPIVFTAALALYWAWRRAERREWKKLARWLALVFGPALLIAAPWWLRNVSLYGGLDIYGFANHDAVVFEQPRTTDWIADYGLRAWLERGVTFTFQSFWGQFGWMSVLLPTWLYRVLALCSLILLIGLVYWLREARSERRFLGPRSGAEGDTFYALRFTILATLVGLGVIAYAYYNRTFVQHQGRYLFTALIPLALGVALALDALLRSLRWPEPLRPLTFALPYLALAALDLYALWRIILPALT